MLRSPIYEFKNLHRGKRVFILASGPSLGGEDLSLLRHRLVMGLNRSCLVYPGSHYQCVMDERLFTEFGPELGRSRYLFTLPGRPFGIPIKLLGGEGFSDDLEKGLYSGYTISYFALQVAIYMGFSQIFYVGLDLKHKAGNTHFFGHDFHSKNHETTEFPKMRRMLEAGCEEARRRGVEVYNCSPVTTIEAMPKMSFAQAVTL
jgi:hypothetical protein